MAQPYPDQPQDFQPAGSNSPYEQQALRRKTWTEQTFEEKIELLRQQLRSKDFALREMREQISILMQHQHGPNGAVLAPLMRLGPPVGSSYDPLA